MYQGKCVIHKPMLLQAEPGEQEVWEEDLEGQQEASVPLQDMEVDQVGMVADLEWEAMLITEKTTLLVRKINFRKDRQLTRLVSLQCKMKNRSFNLNEDFM